MGAQKKIVPRCLKTATIGGGHNHFNNVEKYIRLTCKHAITPLRFTIINLDGANNGGHLYQLQINLDQNQMDFATIRYLFECMEDNRDIFKPESYCYNTISEYLYSASFFFELDSLYMECFLDWLITFIKCMVVKEKVTIKSKIDIQMMVHFTRPKSTVGFKAGKIESIVITSLEMKKLLMLKEKDIVINKDIWEDLGKVKTDFSKKINLMVTYYCIQRKYEDTKSIEGYENLSNGDKKKLQYPIASDNRQLRNEFMENNKGIFDFTDKKVVYEPWEEIKEKGFSEEELRNLLFTDNDYSKEMKTIIVEEIKYLSIQPTVTSISSVPSNSNSNTLFSECTSSSKDNVCSSGSNPALVASAEELFCDGDFNGIFELEMDAALLIDFSQSSSAFR
jgi:hypothetical protein